MKIAVEIPYYAFGARGASQYGENLVRALGRVSPDDQFLVFNYFYHDYERHLKRISKLAAKNVEICVPRWPQRLVELTERRFGYPLVDRHFLKARGVEVFHDAGSHPVTGTPTVVTAHGAAMTLFGVDAFFERNILPSVLKAERVIADSRCIRDMLLKYYPIDPQKLSVIHLGVDHQLFRADRGAAELEAVRKKYSLPERFLLCVGPFQFRDNIELVLYVLHKNRDHKLLKGLRLVLAGGLEEHGRALVRRVRELGLEDRVQFPGYVPHQELASFYNLATVYVHASIYEELGAQLLEASASGAPIVASNSGGIREGAGDAPAYFNPHQMEEFERALLKVLESESLRSEMKAKSVENGRRFNWDEAARQTLDVYRQAAAGARLAELAGSQPLLEMPRRRRS